MLSTGTDSLRWYCFGRNGRHKVISSRRFFVLRPCQQARRQAIHDRRRTAVVPDGGINALSAWPSSRVSSSSGRGSGDAGRYTSDTVPAVVPDSGINALSGLRVPHRFKQRRPAQAQRRRAIHIRRRTCGCAGWRHKCLIRPTSPLLVQTA